MSAVIVEEFRTDRARPVRTALLGPKSLRFTIFREGRQSFGALDSLRAAFLPEGFPNSVTADYLSFQTWDTLQGVSTYIRSMLSTQALLGALGVGETRATVVGATFQWFLRDFTGMLGGILFTLYQGSNLDSSAKQWRLAADFMNDVGMLMDLISPLFPRAFVALLCLGSAARAVTGVASGATRAALTQHFALQKNAADVSAKEGSQETAATLVGMILGLLLARVTSGYPLAVWIFFLLLTGFHMYANFRAVRCLCLTSLNPERLTIILQSYMRDGKVLSPSQVSAVEVVFPYPRMKWLKDAQGGGVTGKKDVIFGARVSSVAALTGYDSFHALIRRYGEGRYLIAVQNDIQVVLHKDAIARDLFVAYVHACLLGQTLQSSLSGSMGTDDAEFECLAWMQQEFPAFVDNLIASGWATDRILVAATEWRADWLSDGEQK